MAGGVLGGRKTCRFTISRSANLIHHPPPIVLQLWSVVLNPLVEIKAMLYASVYSESDLDEQFFVPDPRSVALLQASIAQRDAEQATQTPAKTATVVYPRFNTTKEAAMNPIITHLTVYFFNGLPLRVAFTDTRQILVSLDDLNELVNNHQRADDEPTVYANCNQAFYTSIKPNPPQTVDNVTYLDGGATFDHIIPLNPTDELVDFVVDSLDDTEEQFLTTAVLAA